MRSRSTGSASSGAVIGRVGRVGLNVRVGVVGLVGLAAGAGCTSLVGGATACGDEVGAPACSAGFTCRAGVCEAAAVSRPDAGRTGDAGAGDAGADGDGGPTLDAAGGGDAGAVGAGDAGDGGGGGDAGDGGGDGDAGAGDAGDGGGGGDAGAGGDGGPTLDAAGGGDAGGPDAGPDAGAAVDAGPPPDAGPFRTCAAMLNAGALTADGEVLLDDDGPGGEPPYVTTCLAVAPVFNGGEADLGAGWTLALKVDGATDTFAYDAPLWEAQGTLNPGLASFTPDGDAKLRPFDHLLANEALLVMEVGGVRRGLRVPLPTSTTLQALFHSFTSPLGEPAQAWLDLVPGSVLQAPSRVDGFDVRSDVALGGTAVRLGVLGDDDPLGASSSSFIGVGGRVTSCTFPVNISAGNAGGCGEDQLIPAFAWVFVRETTFTGPTATSCAAHLAAGRRADGVYSVADEFASRTAWCTMSAWGGGWQLMGRSAGTTTGVPFGWRSGNGAIANDLVPYSAGAIPLGVTEVLVGTRFAGTVLGGQVFQKLLPSTFATGFLLATSGPARATTLRATSCTSPPAMLDEVGDTVDPTHFFFRDVSQASDDAAFGLGPAGFTFPGAGPCGADGGLDQAQGLIFVR